MNPAEVVVHVVERDDRLWLSTFFENAFVSRVNRRMPIRIVRFWRSTKLVLMWRGSGLPRDRLLPRARASAGL